MLARVDTLSYDHAHDIPHKNESVIEELLLNV